MKLRIKGNSIRMRLTKSEIAEIKVGRAVSESVNFSSLAKLTYRLSPNPTCQALSAELETRGTETIVDIQIPIELAINWAKSETVSIKNQAEVTPDSLFILIEKDFFCLKPRTHEHEDESDMFDNPNEAHGSCG